MVQYRKIDEGQRSHGRSTKGLSSLQAEKGQATGGKMPVGNVKTIK